MMTELDKILYTSIATIFGGVAVLTLGKLIEKTVIEPFVKFQQTLGIISHNLIFYANIYTNSEVASIDEKNRVSEDFRRLSAELSSGIYSLPFYGFLRVLYRLPKLKDVKNAAASLIGISNAIYSKDNLDHILRKREIIEKCLNIS